MLIANAPSPIGVVDATVPSSAERAANRAAPRLPYKPYLSAASGNSKSPLSPMKYLVFIPSMSVNSLTNLTISDGTDSDASTRLVCSTDLAFTLSNISRDAAKIRAVSFLSVMPVSVLPMVVSSVFDQVFHTISPSFPLYRTTFRCTYGLAGVPVVLNRMKSLSPWMSWA